MAPQCPHTGKGNGQWKAKWRSLKPAVESGFSMADRQDCTEGEQHENMYFRHRWITCPLSSGICLRKFIPYVISFLATYSLNRTFSLYLENSV